MQQTEKRPTRRLKGKLLQFSRGTITQEDLVEEYLLRQELRRAKELHRQQRDWIREQLVLGATIDDSGPRRARLVERFRSNKDGPPTPYAVLLID